MPLQRFVNRTDLPCGSTIGPVTAARLGMTTVDVGAPQLSMHSARELCGVADLAPYVAFLTAFCTRRERPAPGRGAGTLARHGPRVLRHPAHRRRAPRQPAGRAAATGCSDQHEADSIYCVVDLHALTVPQDPAEVRGRPRCDLAQMLLAVGLDPDVCTLFVQSHVHEHTELAWLLECTASIGELRRMTQFKDKSDKADFVSAGLFTYPALQAADILLYDTDGCRSARTSASTSS